MFGGNLGQMKQMMQQMGIDMEEINVEEVTIKTESGEVLKFDNSVDVNKMDAQGETIYQVIGEPTKKSGVSDEQESQENESEEESTSDESSTDGIDINEDDVEIVSLRAGVSGEDARQKLEETNGDLAKAISELDD